MTEKTTAAATAPAEPKAAPRFEVKLIAPHTHARKDYVAGDTIKVTARQRQFLVEAGVIEGAK
ncbi:hypothetical protein NA655_08575 [Pseudomonas kuykendallii]|uniref:DUF7210 domain-containing protein n=1 Tax=Pseudomonas kuykendallii TaxID=1007099 RepID=A0A1H3EJ65_9PSED|nr:hypothetical protein [Pseudomonas kuykendallii]MCQ4271074.1 hypothetical protein [Pseudomonas kuykendallii]SDX78823.1 hypothetical protein SAMN05216287_3748 [Pseudomonas kuykendallii]